MVLSPVGAQLPGILYPAVIAQVAQQSILERKVNDKKPSAEESLVSKETCTNVVQGCHK